MDSPDIADTTTETGQHQSTIEQFDVEDVKPQMQLSENQDKSTIEPAEFVSSTNSDSPLTPSSVAAKESKTLTTEESFGEPTIDQEKEVNKLPVISDDSSLSIPTKEMPKNGSDDEPSSSMTSSTTTIEEVKQMSKRQITTVLILCFVNLLKYMDRFTIAGTAVLLYDNKFYLVSYYSRTIG
jgi:hypothetical protein